MVAVSTIVGIAIPVIRLSIKVKRAQCKQADAKFPLACVFLRPGGVPPGSLIRKVATKKVTIKEAVIGQRDASFEALTSGGIDPDKLFALGARGAKRLSKGKSAEKATVGFLKSFTKTIK